MTRLAMALVTIGILGGIASASPITYVETTTATGTLGGVAFTNAAVTVTLVGDTSNIVPGPSPFGSFLINPGITTIQIAGFQLATFTDLTEIISSFNQANPAPFGAPVVLFAKLDNPQGTSVTGIVFAGNPTFLGYGLTAQAPISVTGGDASGLLATHHTNRGDLIFSSDNDTSASTFSATASVPEPTSAILLGAGLLSLVSIRSRRRRP
jgi:hypothetical protein